MARKTKRLSARSIAALTKPGRHSDGEGLYLVIDPSGAKRWAFIFRWGGKLKEMGLGGLSAVSLADARDRAGEARRLLARGSNPIEARRAAAAARQSATSFGTFADGLVDHLSHGFRNEEHRRQWAQTLKTYAAPLRDMPIETVQSLKCSGLSWARPLYPFLTAADPSDRRAGEGMARRSRSAPTLSAPGCAHPRPPMCGICSQCDLSPMGYLREA